MSDTMKLNLIKEHALEYYDYPRVYKVTERGLMVYSIATRDTGVYLYIADMFISKQHRGTDAFKELIDFTKQLIKDFDITSTCARTNLDNPFFNNMYNMYTREGFEESMRDDEAVYYVRNER